MKRLTTTCAAALVLLSASYADAQVTMTQAQSMIENGQARKLPAGFVLPEGNVTSDDMRFPMAARNMQGVAKPTNHFDLTTVDGKKAPMRTTAGGSDICGLVTYSDDHAIVEYGLWSIEATTMKERWKDYFSYENGYSMRNGFFYEDQIVGNAVYEFMGYVFGYSRVVLDYFTGELIEQNHYEYSDHDCLLYSKLAYNTTDGFVYGVVFDDDGSGGWYRTTTDRFDTGERLGDTNRLMTSLAFCPKDGNFYGFDTSGNFVRIETATGKYTNVLDMHTQFKNINYSAMSALVWSPVEKLFYATLRNDQYAYLFTFGLDSEEINKPVTLIPARAQFAFMITADPVDDNPKKPATPTYVSNSFPEGATSGTVDFLIPTETEDGSKIEGNLYAFPSVNSTAVGPAEGYAVTPGQTLTVEYKDVPEGYNSFKLFVLSNEGRSRTVSETVFIGNDTPLAPKTVLLKANKVSWTKVKEGVNGGYLATDELLYKVYINDEYVGETTKTSLEFDLNLEDNYYAIYRAQVTCECRGKVSEAGESSILKIGKPFDLPMTIVPTEDQFNLTTVINPGNDKSYWWHNGTFGMMLGSYSAKDNDDWLIMPPFNATSTEKYYTLTFEATRIESYSVEDYLTVYVGSEPTVKGMATEVLGEFVPATSGRKNEFGKYSVLFKAPAEGACYIGFYGRSKGSESGLILKNVNIFDSNVTENSPAEVLNLDAQPLEGGVLKATVSFNMPRKTVGGETIAKDADLKVTIKSDAETLELKGTPGQRISTEIATVQGRNIITVMPGIGELGALVSEVAVYTGVVAPATPKITGLKVAPDMQSMTLTWDPVTTGVDNGVIDPEDVQYIIYKQVIPLLGGARWEKFAEVGKETKFVYEAETDYPDYVLLGVSAANAAGENGTIAAASGLCGTPYVIPMSESFKSGFFDLSSWSSKEPKPEYKIEYNLYEIKEFGTFDTDNQYALVGVGEVGDKGRLAVPRFTTQDLDEAFFSCSIYTGKNASPVTLYAGYTGAEKLIEFGKIEPNPNGPDFSDFTFALPKEAMGKNWVQIYMDTEYKTAGQLFMLTSVDVTDITGVESVAAGVAHVVAGNGCIRVSGCMGKTVTVTSINGFTVVRDIPVNNNAVYNLAKGIYIVKVGDRNVKVAVK